MIREWNNWSDETRNASSVSAFKSRPVQNIIVAEIPKYFRIGDRRLQMLHIRLRTNCTSLNHDIYLKNISVTFKRTCGSTETADHLLLACTIYLGKEMKFLGQFYLFALFVLMFSCLATALYHFEAAHN